MNNKKNILEKLKNIKNIEIIIALGLAVIALFVFLSDFGQKTTKQSNSSGSFSAYVSDLENKLFSATIQIDCQKLSLVSVNGSCYKNNEKLSS